MIICAMGPWPWPSEMMWSRSFGARSICVPNRWSIAVGSAPVDRMKMMGVLLVVSLYTSSSFSGGFSVNLRPSFSLPGRAGAGGGPAG